MPRRAVMALALAVMAFGPAAAREAGQKAGQRVEQPSADPEIARTLDAMRARDARLLDIGWKLSTANAPFCKDAPPAIGLMLADLLNFGDIDAVAEVWGGYGRVRVQASAQGSPAAHAGLTPLTHIIAVDGATTDAAITPESHADSWRNLVRLNEVMESALGDHGSVTLKWFGANGLTRTQKIAGIPACNARMEPRDGEDRARADGNRILIGSDFPGFTYPEDEFAAAIAHEMAHIVLGHSAWLDKAGRKRRNVRLTEHEADRLAPWLLANAGYDPLAAGRFMRRWGPEHGGGLLRKRTHSGWDERAEFMDDEAAQVAQIMAETGSADWSKLFDRDLPL